MLMLTTAKRAFMSILTKGVPRTPVRALLGVADACGNRDVYLHLRAWPLASRRRTGQAEGRGCGVGIGVAHLGAGGVRREGGGWGEEGRRRNMGEWGRYYSVLSTGFRLLEQAGLPRDPLNTYKRILCSPSFAHSSFRNASTRSRFSSCVLTTPPHRGIFSNSQLI